MTTLPPRPVDDFDFAVGDVSTAAPATPAPVQRNAADEAPKRATTHIPHEEQIYHVYDAKRTSLYRLKAKHVSDTVGSAHYHSNQHVAPSDHMTLPPGRLMEVHDAKERHVCEYIPTHCILRTLGSETWFGKAVPDRRVFHCEHFRKRRLCTMGPRCAFIHAVTVTAMGHFPQPDEAMMTTSVESSLTTLPRSASSSSMSSRASTEHSPLTQGPTVAWVAQPAVAVAAEPCFFRFDPYSMECVRVVLH